MDKFFEVEFLEEAVKFLKSLDKKVARKIIYNIRKAQASNDKRLFKKLNEDIWEFRTFFNKTQFRILAFWDKRGDNNTLVIATHGFIKKSSKVPRSDIKKAEEMKKKYFKLN